MSVCCLLLMQIVFFNYLGGDSAQFEFDILKVFERCVEVKIFEIHCHIPCIARQDGAVSYNLD